MPPIETREHSPLLSDIAPRPARSHASLPPGGWPGLLRRGAALLALLLVGCPLQLLAGNGPHNWLVVYDPGDPHGVAIARHYQEARGFPDRNLVAYDFPRRAAGSPSLKHELTNAQAWDFILALRADIAERGLDGQIHGVTLVGNAPNKVRESGASITTALMMAPGTASLTEWENRVNDFNEAYRGHEDGPPIEIRSDIAFSGNNYWLSTHLGFTGLQGLRAEEVFDLIDRSAAADGAAPQGTVYWPLNINVRSTIREPQAPLVEPEWQSLGLDYHIFGQSYGGGSFYYPEGKRGGEGSFPISERSVQGVLAGKEQFDVFENPSIYTPGAIAEHITSFGGQFGNSMKLSQTRCTEWLRAGASGTSGTVVEPYADTDKFPHARIHSHYFMGSSLAEAFLLTIRQPWQTLVMGDGLTQPYADIPAVTISNITPGQSLSGTVTLLASATATGGVESDHDLAVNGRVIKIGDPGEPVTVTRVPGGFEIDTTTLPNGWHELRVIAYSDSPVRSQGFATREISVQNGSGTLPLSGPTSVTFDADLSVTATPTGLSDVTGIEIRSMGQTLATLGAGGGTITIPGNALTYKGTNHLFAVATTSTGEEIHSTPLEVTATWTPLPPLPEAPVIPGTVAIARYFADVTDGGFDWDATTPTAVLPVNDRFAAIVEKADQWPWLVDAQKPGAVGGVEFVTRFFARETAIHDFVLTGQSWLGLVVDGNEIVPAMGGNPVMPSVPLEAGWHELRFRTRIPGGSNVNIKPFEAAFRARGTGRRHPMGWMVSEYENFTLDHCVAPADIATTRPTLTARATGTGAATLEWNDPFATETAWTIERFVGDPGVSLVEYLGGATPPTLVTQGEPNAMGPLAPVANDDPGESFTVVPPYLQPGTRLFTANADRADDGQNTLYRVDVPAGVTIYAVFNSKSSQPPWMSAQGGWTKITTSGDNPTGLKVESQNTNLWTIYSKTTSSSGIVELGGPEDASYLVDQSHAITFVFIKDGDHWETIDTLPPNATSGTISGLDAGVHRLRVRADLPPDAQVPSSPIDIDLGAAQSNGTPTVDAGPDLRLAGTGVTATLRGNAIDDGLPNPPGTLSLTWSQTSGPGTATFGPATAATTTADFSAPGTYTLRIEANDGSATASDTVEVIVGTPNAPPVADAGNDQTITVLDGLVLDGSATDDGLPALPGSLSYEWRQTGGPAGNAVFDNRLKPDAQVYFRTPGTYTLELTASDGSLSGTDAITLTVGEEPDPNQPPTVDIADTIDVYVGQPAPITPTVSDDGKPDPPAALTYSWTQIDGPDTVAFSSTNTANTNVTVPAAGSYTIRLSVSDSWVMTTVDVTLSATFDPAGNQAPSVTLGTNQEVYFTDVAFVDVAVSDDGQPDPPGGLTFTWETLSGPGTLAAAFHPDSTRAVLAFDQPGEYTVRLTADDGANSASDSVDVSVREIEHRIVHAWGHNYYAQAGPFETGGAMTDTHAVGRGWNEVWSNTKYGVALTRDGRVLVSGLSFSPPLGVAGAVPRPHFEAVPGLGPVVDIADADESIAAALEDGTVWTWGASNNGSLGLGVLIDSRAEPTQIPGLSGIRKLFGFFRTFFAVDANGDVWGWGYNADGKLGDGGATNQPSPIQIPGLTEITEIDCGYLHSLFLRNDGSLLASGGNLYGAVGNGTLNRSLVPTPVLTATAPDTPLTGIVTIAAGNYHSLALDTNGQVWAWGENNEGQLGLNNYDDQPIARRVLDPDDPSGFLSDVVDIATAREASFAVKADGSVVGWGSGGQNIFGPGQPTGDRLVPGPVSGLPPVREIVARHYTAFATTPWASYDGFVSEHFTAQEIADGKAAPDFVDPATGLANLALYGLNRSPGEPTGEPPVSLRVEGGQLVVETETLATADDLEVVLESSTDLAQWDPATPDEATHEDRGDTVRATLRFNLGPDPDSLFLRLRFNQPQP